MTTTTMTTKTSPYEDVPSETGRPISSGNFPGVASANNDNNNSNNNINNAFHLWNLLYSASISLCLFLLLKVAGSSTSMTAMMTTITLRRGAADDDLLLPPYVGEKDVEISLKRLARDALRAMPIRRYQV